MTKDMTRGSPARLILRFTIPLLIGNLFQQLYNMADTLIVGRTLGVTALAAVGCTGSLVFFVLGFVQGLTSGFAIVTAQRFGAEDEAGVRKSFAIGILLSIAVTALMTALSVWLARPMLVLLQTPDNILDDAWRYIVVIFAGIGASMLFNLLSNILRALGDSRTPLVFLVIASVLNIVLDFVLILYAGMGVQGAAVATVAAQVFSGLLCILFIVRKFPMLHLHREDWRFALQDVWAHIRMGLPMGFQASIIAIGAIMIQFVLNGLGSLSVAAYTVAQKVDSLATQPMMSFGMTMATYTGQNYGAGNIPRISKGVRQCLLMSVSFSIAVGLVNIFAGRLLAGLFVSDQPEAAGLSQVYLVINGAMYALLAVLFIIRYTLQGLGKSGIPTLAGIMELLMRCFAAVILARYFGFAGASASNPLAWFGALIPLCTAYFITMRRLTADYRARIAAGEIRDDSSLGQ